MNSPTLLALLGILSALDGRAVVASDWPQFLGPARNGVALGEVVSSKWPDEGPRRVWQLSVGQGFSGPVVENGRLILFHRRGDKEVIDCLEAGTGKPLWHFESETDYRDDFGFDEGPRATPVINNGKVYTFGAEGALHCLELESGKPIWSHQVKQEFQSRKGFFGMACSPLVSHGKVLVNIGGAQNAGIVAFDQNTGHLVWRSTDEEASYSSPTEADFGSGPRALFFARSGLLALDPESGRTVFRFPWRSRAHASVNAASPLVVGDRIFLSACYETGAALLQVTNDAVRKIWSSDDVLSNHYASSVYDKGFLYGFHGRQESGQVLRCVELPSGKVRWTQSGFGAGTLLLCGGPDNPELLVMKEDGQLLLLGATPSQYQERARAQVLPNGVRAYPALADGFFFARSKDKLICLDLRPQ